MKEHGGISKRQAEALIVLQSLVYGFGDPISKIAFEVTPVYTMMTVRYLIAFAVSFLVFHKRISRTVRTVPVKAWLIPGVCISLHYILNNVALALTDATSVAFLRSLSIVITPAFAFLIYRTSYKWQHIVLQILVLPGMYLLCVRGGLSGAGSGEAVALVAAFMSAGALVFSKRYLDMVDPVSMTALMAGCSAGIALIGSLIFEGGIRLETTTPHHVPCDYMYISGLFNAKSGSDSDFRQIGRTDSESLPGDDRCIFLFPARGNSLDSRHGRSRHYRSQCGSREYHKSMISPGLIRFPSDTFPRTLRSASHRRKSHLRISEIAISLASKQTAQ